MTIQAKAYANKKAENDKPNRVNAMMSMEEAQAIAAKDKTALTELVKAIAEVAK